LECKISATLAGMSNPGRTLGWKSLDVFNSAPNPIPGLILSAGGDIFMANET
jgi:hypothetical protein